MNSIKFRVAAKTDVGLVRTNNEDNFQVASDLSSPYMHWVNNEICSLGEKGALLVVADGMGGMNAGEVASALAIETVKEYFQAERLTPEVMKTRFSIEKFMNEAIVAADTRIKREAREHPESRGMGTTIVIGWLLGQRLYVSWCGDSRAYVYNPATGLHQITKDHSYVQSLVDKGVITREDAFDYPESNIITRSLSDGAPKAKPESLLKPYELCDGDIVLLCTDGLSGMLHDSEMETILRQNEHDLSVCVDELIRGACEAAGADNVTICLCQILQGGGIARQEAFAETEARLNGPLAAIPSEPGDVVGTQIGTPKRQAWRKYVAIGGICLLLVAAGGVAGYYIFSRSASSEKVAAKPGPVPGDSASKGTATPSAAQPTPPASAQPQRGATPAPAGALPAKSGPRILDQGFEDAPEKVPDNANTRQPASRANGQAGAGNRAGGSENGAAGTANGATGNNNGAKGNENGAKGSEPGGNPNGNDPIQGVNPKDGNNGKKKAEESEHEGPDIPTVPA